MTASAEGRIRVRPRVWIGLVILVVYVAVVFLVQAMVGISYIDLGASGINLFLGAASR